MIFNKKIKHLSTCDLTKEQIEKMSKGKLKVKQEIAQRSDLTEEQIERLSRDKNHYVRTCIARNSILNEEQIERLSKDKVWYIKYAIFQRFNYKKE